MVCAERKTVSGYHVKRYSVRRRVCCRTFGVCGRYAPLWRYKNERFPSWSLHTVKIQCLLKARRWGSVRVVRVGFHSVNKNRYGDLFRTTYHAGGRWASGLLRGQGVEIPSPSPVPLIRTGLDTERLMGTSSLLSLAMVGWGPLGSRLPFGQG